MEFLGVGYQEVLLVFILMLVVVGPERMPAVAYQIGRAVRTLQKYARAVRDEFSTELQYIDEEYKELRGELESTSASLRAERLKLEEEWRRNQAAIESDVNATVESAKTPQGNGARPAAGAPRGGEEGEPAVAAAEPAKGDGSQRDGPPLVF